MSETLVRPKLASGVMAALLLVAGPVVAQTQPCDPSLKATYGCWDAVQGCSSDPPCSNGYPLRQAIHLILTYTGKVLLWDDDSPTGVVLWDPVTLAGTAYNNTGDNLFCGGHAVLGDGRVIVIGGNVYPSQCNNTHLSGRNDVWIFDPSNPGWTEVGAMSWRRWYPTATVLPDGKILSTSGLYCDIGGPKGTACMPEVFDPFTSPSAPWTSLTSASGNCRYTDPWYPWMHVLASGKVLHAGPHRSSDTPPKMQLLDAKPGQAWLDFGASNVGGAMSVMYRSKDMYSGAKALMLMTGHVYQISAQTEVVDDDGANTPGPSLAYARNFHNACVLPNGTVLVTGGATAFDPTLADAVKQTELWTPASGPNGSWSTLAPSPTARMYHSTAVLLPDGRVLSAGGEYKIADFDYGHNLNADFYSPPYLFKSNNDPIADADRPAITGNPPLSIVYGEGLSFARSTGSGSAISSVALIRPGAVTHSNNMDQRYVPLSGFTDGATLTVPASSMPNRQVAPPGYYMLFLVNNDTPGRPSKAPFVVLWEVLQETVAHTNLIINPDGTFDIDFGWNTTAKATDGDELILKDPSGNIVQPISQSGNPSADGLSHTWHAKVSCIPGYWTYQLRSKRPKYFAGDGLSVSTSTAQTFRVIVCLEP